MIERASDGGCFENEAGYCRAVSAAGWISVSSTIAPVSGDQDLASLDTYQQTYRALVRGFKAVTELGGAKETIVRTRVFLAPEASWLQMSYAHQQLFASTPPANTAHYVHGLIPPGALVEIELEAIVLNVSGERRADAESA